MENCRTRAAGVKGFLSDAEGMALHRYASRALRLGPCLEIGSYCGKSAVFLGLACKRAGGTLFSVDHHHGSEEQQPGEGYFDPELYDCRAGCVDTFGHFRRTLKANDLEGCVVPIVCRSAVAARHWRTPLGLVFIDGGHALETVSADYRLWAPHVLPGGYLLFHDVYERPELGGQAPYRVFRTAVASGRFFERERVGCLAVLERATCGELFENNIDNLLDSQS